ncbi:choline-binding transcriptional repressor BetI [Oryzicola mucosus]|uniref:HTH-type transcriptional regulator BetI n=1 Tax=Oryzicola mucosus TaxID=2767425 RepID=A0A8J6PUJ8_9HYPH|nr:transcriptional regulator BetI [Oryzicola mucosus]MBD0415949.1 transcriptional regulator BetI [Oryzicola mucosus]
MPKVGMQPLRRKALIDATILAIGERGSLDVTMSEIAGRAGVSSALAHHYFGAKDDLLEATMRYLLTELNADARLALRAAQTPLQRVSAVVAVNFSEKQFRSETIAAWLAFYVEAQKSQALRRLLRVYARRLHSNLMSGLAPLLPPAQAERAAETIAALIDGLYIRRALRDGLPDAATAAALVEAYLANLPLGTKGRA